MATSHPTNTSVRVRLSLANFDACKSKLEDKLHIYFQKKKVSGGCDVDDVSMVSDDDDGVWIRVTFNEPAGVQKVLAKDHHELNVDGVKIPLEVKEDKPPPGSPAHSDEDSSGTEESFFILASDDAEKGSDDTGGYHDIEGSAGKLDPAGASSAKRLHPQAWWPMSSVKAARFNMAEHPPPHEIVGDSMETSSSVLLPSTGARTPKGATHTCMDGSKEIQSEDMYGRGDNGSMQGLGTPLQASSGKVPSSATLRLGSQTGTLGGTIGKDVSSEKMYGNCNESLQGHYIEQQNVQVSSLSWVPTDPRTASQTSREGGSSAADSMYGMGDSFQEPGKVKPAFDGTSQDYMAPPGDPSGYGLFGGYGSFHDYRLPNVPPPGFGITGPFGSIGSERAGTDARSEYMSSNSAANLWQSQQGWLYQNLGGGSNQGHGSAQHLGVGYPGSHQHGPPQGLPVAQDKGDQTHHLPTDRDPSDEAPMQQDDLQEELEEEVMVEVTNFKPNTDEFLKMYFENRRKSGGGKIKTWEKDTKTGAIRLTYADTAVAQAVVNRRSHKVGGATLTVKLVVRKKPRPPPIKKQCLFLAGIPDGCSSEHVSLFVENRCGMDEEPNIRYGEKPGTALCTFSEDIPDQEKVIARMSSKKLQGVHLTVEMVCESDCILVEGFSSETPPEVIELYFDNKKRSGGIGVREVQQGPGDGQAVVYFEDWRVVHDVLSRKSHKLGSNELSVEEYYDCLGRLSPLDAPTPNIPKPVAVPVPEAIMEFIFGKGKDTKKKLMEELSNVKAKLHWPNGDNKTEARLEPVEDGQQQSHWLNWPKTSAEVLTGFLKRCASSRVAIQQQFWKDASAKIEQISTKSFSIELDVGRHVVHLVGEQQDVERGVADINNVIKELQAKAEYEAQQTKEEVDLSLAKLKLFTICGIKDKIEQSFPDLKITPTTSRDKMILIFEGTRKNVQEAELLMRRQMDSLGQVEFKTGNNKAQFIRDVSDKIHEIFGSQNIRAVCSGSVDGKIVINGATRKDIDEARGFIDQEIEESTIAIKGKAALGVLQSQSGEKLLSGINKQKFVRAGIISNQAESCIELAGFKTNMMETRKRIIQFLKDNVIMQTLINLNKNKMQLIMNFHGQEILAAENIKNHVKIQTQMRGRNKGFVIQGNEEGLETACQVINGLVGSIKEQQYPVSKTGMAELFREDKGKKFLESLEKEFQCVIREEGQEDSDEEAEDGGSMSRPTPGATTEVLCRIALPGGFTLRVCRGDLTKQKVDCIVNAANIDLKHFGGLAAAVLQAGGQVIQTESDAIIKTKLQRQLYVGEAVHTSSGRLPCKKVLHVAGPKWPHLRKVPKPTDEPTHEEKLLHDGVLACLKLANNKLKFQSIAIPAISTGVYGFPIELAAQQILNAVDEFWKIQRNPSLTEIDLTNNDKPTCNVFRQAVLDRFSQYQEDEDIGTDIDAGDLIGAVGPVVDDEPTTVTPRFTVSGPNILTTKEGITISLKKGSITNETVDVIVNTAGSDMKLNNGKVSQAILQAAGPALQQECDTLTATQGSITAGSFIKTGSGALSCKNIYHCVCAGYGQTQAEEFLKKLVFSLMEDAEKQEMLSIAIPALGTGNLNYPPDVTARSMYEAISEFSSQHPNGVLKDVRFVVYDKDAKTIQGFEDEIQCLATGRVSGAAAHNPIISRTLKRTGSTSTGVTDRESYSQIRRDHKGVLQTKIGSVCLQVEQGDLTKETSNAIVNSVGPNLDLTGPVSKVLLASGGDTIEKECSALRNKDKLKSVHVTGSGRLPCGSIVHVITPRTPEGIKTAVAKTLKVAEDKKFRSVSFPALGTGQAGQAVGVCASSVLSAIGEFAIRKKPRHLHLIRLVIFQANMLPDFEEALRKEVGTSYKQPRSLMSRGIGWVSTLFGATAAEEVKEDDEDLQESMILCICAMDVTSIKRAESRLEQFQMDEYTSEDRPDELGLIDLMTDEHRAQLRAIEKKLNVRIETLSRGQMKFMRVQGRTISVKDACIKIQELFTRMQKEETEIQRRERLVKEVQWKYSSSDGMEAYDPEINVIIEDAYQKKRPSVQLDLEEGKVTIDFQQMMEISSGSRLNVHRVDLSKAASFEMPSNWGPMTASEHFKMVPLIPASTEYTTVQGSFQTSVGGAVQIVEIQRVQNKELMMQYQARKAAIEGRLGRTNIEETLYHGTDEQTCDKINKHGFNRSFCGKNATVYGNGTYFAVQASYSARSQYAKPNANGMKHIYVTKVLVGDYTRGSQGMITPPNKPNYPDQLYESVVDNVQQPGIYVIFHDAQAYPEYLIKFQ